MYSSGISELVLIVKDVLSSARFYEEVVALMPEKEVNDKWAGFWAGRGAAPSLAKGPLLSTLLSESAERSMLHLPALSQWTFLTEQGVRLR
jgi:hypothetical protein